MDELPVGQAAQGVSHQLPLPDALRRRSPPGAHASSQAARSAAAQSVLHQLRCSLPAVGVALPGVEGGPELALVQGADQQGGAPPQLGALCGMRPPGPPGSRQAALHHLAQAHLRPDLQAAPPLHLCLPA